MPCPWEPDAWTKASRLLAVFAYSAAIAGLARAHFAVYYRSVGVTDFQLTVGLLYLLLAVGGTAMVSSTVFGGLGLTAFTWLASAFSGVTAAAADVLTDPEHQEQAVARSRADQQHRGELGDLDPVGAQAADEHCHQAIVELAVCVKSYRRR